MERDGELSKIFDMPDIVRAADLEGGQKRLDEAMAALAPLREAAQRAGHQIRLVQAADLLDGAKGLERVKVEVDYESNGGGVYIRLGVVCEYDVEGKFAPWAHEPSIGDDLQELLDDDSDKLNGSEAVGRPLEPRAFLAALAKALLGPERGAGWIAEREAVLLAEQTPASSKRSAPRKL